MAIDIERLLKVSGVRCEMWQELGFVVKSRPEVRMLVSQRGLIGSS